MVFIPSLVLQLLKDSNAKVKKTVIKHIFLISLFFKLDKFCLYCKNSKNSIKFDKNTLIITKNKKLFNELQKTVRPEKFSGRTKNIPVAIYKFLFHKVLTPINYYDT